MTDRHADRAPLAMGWLAAGVVVLGLGGFATQVRIASAIVAPGVVDSAAQRIDIQHVDGGRIAEVPVTEAAWVPEGAVLVRLDDTALAQEEALWRDQQAQARALIARLDAEAQGHPALPPPPPGADAAFATQATLLAARRASLTQQRRQLDERRAQALAESAGLAPQRAALEAENALIEAEEALRTRLVTQGLAPQAAQSPIQRERLRLAGALAALSTRAEALQAQIAEIEAQRAALDATHRAEVEAERARTIAQLAEIDARLALVAMRRAERVLRAPVAGQVQALQARAGAVLRPGQTALHLIAATPDPALVLTVDPDAIARLHPGQEARVSITALALRGLPDLPARVATISAAPFADEASQRAVFRVELALTDTGRALLGAQRLAPGMSLTGFIPTGQRTPMAYLLDPVTSRLRLALREP